jgi:hypothetical protein
VKLSLQSLGGSETRRGIIAASEKAEKFGLSLTEGEVEALLQARERALRDTGRVELKGGILPRLIEVFMSSPYIDEDSFAETLCTLQESFYYFKNESDDLIPDEDLLERMRFVFDECAHGSAELLGDMTLGDFLHSEKRDEDDEDDWD